MVDLEKARERIAEQLAHLLRRTDGIQRDMRRENNPLAADWDEQAAIRANDEVLDALDAEGREQIQRLQTALNRIDDGSYGKCDDCGGEISEVRLEALPHALECIDCARKAEQEE